MKLLQFVRNSRNNINSLETMKLGIPQNITTIVTNRTDRIKLQVRLRIIIAAIFLIYYFINNEVLFHWCLSILLMVCWKFLRRKKEPNSVEGEQEGGREQGNHFN